MPEKYVLTEEHRAQMAPWAQKWIDNALSTKQMTDEDKARVRKAIFDLYRVSNLQAPKQVVFSASPLSGAIAAGCAAAIYWCRDPENAGSLKEISKSKITETKLLAAAELAILNAVRVGYNRVIHLSKCTDVQQIEKDSAAAATETIKTFYEAIGSERPPKHVKLKDQEQADLMKFLNECIGKAWYMRNGGNQWSGWTGYISFFDEVVGLNLPEFEKWRPYREAATGTGPRYMHNDFTVCSDLPTIIGKDNQHRPHSDTGPSLAWSDGWRIYNVHGVSIDENTILYPEKITVSTIESEANAERRRVMIEKFGAARYIKETGAQLIDDDPKWGKLWKKTQEGDEDILMVELVNSTPESDGTYKTYFLRVHPQCCPLLKDGQFGEPQELTAHAAVASTHGKRAEEYDPEIET